MELSPTQNIRPCYLITLYQFITLFVSILHTFSLTSASLALSSADILYIYFFILHLHTNVKKTQGICQHNLRNITKSGTESCKLTTRLNV